MQLKFVIILIFISNSLWTVSAYADSDCARIFPEGTNTVMRGSTLAGIKNKFEDPIEIEVTALPGNAAGVRFSGGKIISSRLPNDAVVWRAEDDEIWGNQCLNVTLPNGTQLFFLALSWDSHYHHPNVHGLVKSVDGGWEFWGYLDNAKQQYHEALLNLRWFDAR